MFFVHFSRDDGFLLVTARHGTNDCYRTLTATYVVFFDKFVGILSYRFETNKSAFLEFGFEITLQNHILFERIVENKTVFVSVFGNMREAVRVTITYVLFGNIFAVKVNLAFFYLV